eukprot:CAMPEP_0183497326 /NCGR_PEP_ID=MMETSP0370-20130417/185394_1 /TAXON_ID=268820 /ORGANISM="Peridinium aciculiferum, Strain PAER-2" /LENGTH=193 /DNA_ID=CAMNT_0025690673 /DNA_START=235 /DNA_END=817 /DNA_ORIENTATION=+
MTLLSIFGCTPLNRNGSTAKTEASLQAKLHGSNLGGAPTRLACTCGDNVQGAFMDTKPNEAEDEDTTSEDAQDARDDLLMLKHHRILAHDDANGQPSQRASKMRGMAGAAAVGLAEDGVGDVQPHEEQQHHQRWIAELLLVPIHDQVCKVDAEEGVASSRASDDNAVGVADVEAHRTAKDSKVEHDRQPPPPM